MAVEIEKTCAKTTAHQLDVFIVWGGAHLTKCLESSTVCGGFITGTRKWVVFLQSSSARIIFSGSSCSKVLREHLQHV